MDRVPDEVLSHVLACLQSRDVSRLAACCHGMNQSVRRIGCMSSPTTFRKAVANPPTDKDDAALTHFAFESLPHTMNVVTLRPTLYQKRGKPAAGLLLQCLNLVGESDAAEWFARRFRLQRPTPAASSSSPPVLALPRTVAWDFSMYSFACNALQHARLPLIKLYVSSLPVLTLDDRPLFVSAQSFLGCLLTQASHCECLSLHMVGCRHNTYTHHAAQHADEHATVDRLLSEWSWPEDTVLESVRHFRSSNVGLGIVLMSTGTRLHSLKLAQYTFDDSLRPSVDVRLLCQYLMDSQLRHGRRLELDSQICWFERNRCSTRGERGLGSRNQRRLRGAWHGSRGEGWFRGLGLPNESAATGSGASIENVRRGF